MELGLFPLLVIGLAFLFEFANGWTDAPNAIATVVSTRVLTPLAAVIMAAVLNLAGAFWGTAVAKTIGKGIVSADMVTLSTVAAALAASILWSLTAQYFGLPSSESHALIAGLIGAALATAGPGALHVHGILKVVVTLITSPLLGMAAGYALMVGIYWMFRRMTPGRIRQWFGKLQIASAGFMAFGHGTGDAQKTMGVVTLILFMSGALPTFEVPTWVIFACAAMMGLGTAFGGWRVVKTLGVSITKLEPVQGFAAETAAAAVIVGCSHYGLPVSTTHIIGSSIMGVGATRRLSAVRWGVAGSVFACWILTWPGCMAMGYIFSKIFHLWG